MIDLWCAAGAGFLGVGIVGVEHLDWLGAAGRLSKIGIWISKIIIAFPRTELFENAWWNTAALFHGLEEVVVDVRG